MVIAITAGWRERRSGQGGGISANHLPSIIRSQKIMSRVEKYRSTYQKKIAKRFRKGYQEQEIAGQCYL